MSLHVRKSEFIYNMFVHHNVNNMVDDSGYFKRLQMQICKIK